MKNVEILELKRNELIENEIIEEYEEINSFQEWKRLGFIVKKDSKSIGKVGLWIPTKKKEKASEDGEESEEEKSSYFMKQTALFSSNQVEPLKKAMVS